MSLSGPPWWAYGRTYGLPDLTVPDGDWAIAVLRAGQPPELAVVSTQRVIPTTDIGSGQSSCADAERLRFRLDFEARAGWPSLLHVSDKP